MIDAGGYIEETSIVINPNHQREMLAGTNPDHYYFSTNGGVSWTGGFLSSPWGVAGDPCVTVDARGNYFYFHLSITRDGSSIDRIVCQQLSTLGGTWSPGSYMGLNGKKTQDKPWATIDRGNNHIYATWTQFDVYDSGDPTNRSIIRFSASADGGESWSVPVRINRVDGDCQDSSNTVEGAVPAVGPNGEIFVAWAGPAGLVMNKSLDGGTTWLEQEIFISDIPGGWDFAIPGLTRCNGWPVTVCDLSSGPHRGTVYVNWSDQRNGTNDTDIWLTKSIDGGQTWSPRKRVNDDPPGGHQFFTWMTVDQSDGTLYFVFYDRRNYLTNRISTLTDVYLAVSRDGGETFANTRISQSPFNPRGAFLGDYTGISAHNGVVRPIWTRTDSTGYSIWTAIIDPPPGIQGAHVTNGSVYLSLTNLTSYLTNYIERAFDLGAAEPWARVGTITGVDGSTTWSESLAGSKAFYRIRGY